MNMFIHVCMNKDIKAVNLIEIKECAMGRVKGEKVRVEMTKLYFNFKK